MQLIANGTQGGTSVPTKQTPSGTPGYANSGPPGTFTPTVFDPDMGNTLIAEIVAVILASGQSLSASNNAQLLAAIRILPAGRLLNILAITTSGTYTPTAGTQSIDAIAVGGGGAGGGGFATSGSTYSVGSGGGSGAIVRGRYTSGFSGTVVTIGSAGAPASGAAGGAGGTTSFGALLTAPGGGGGPTATIAVGSTTVSGQGAPGAFPSGSGVIFASAGQSGGNGLILPSTPISGIGAPGPLGGGGGVNTSGGGGGGAAGPGAGGGGSANLTSQASNLGGAGFAGTVIIVEYS